MSTKPTNERAFHRDHAQLNANGAAKVEETPDFYIIPDQVLTTDGVMNGARKTRDDLAMTWMLFNGIPQAHDHPGGDEFGLVIDQRRLCGFVDNVRFTDKTGDVVGDYYLARRSMPGLSITPDMVAATDAVVASVRAGKRVDTSIGFWSSDEQLPAPVEYDGPNDAFRGQQYDRVQRFIVPDHNAFVDSGACGSTCSINANHLHDHARAQREHEEKQGDDDMKPNQDCDKAELLARLETITQERDALKKTANATPADDGKVAAMERQLKETTEALGALKQRADAADTTRLDQKRAALAKLTGKDAKDLPLMAEAALDFTIEREMSFRGKADGSRIARGADAPRATKDGMQELPSGGFTVVDMNAVTPKPAVN